MLRLTKNNQQGFTIIEMMIAMVVFSTILVMVSAMMIGISRLYYKGINQASVQEATRNIAEQVSQSIQLTDHNPIYGTKTFGPINAEAYCMNNVRYSFVKNMQMGSDADDSRHVLWRDTNNPGGSVCVPLNVNSNLTDGTELALEGSRLTEFSISDVEDSDFANRINVGLAYGDSDLLKFSGENTRCLGDTGGQFCATSKQNMLVTRRLTGR